MNIKQAVEEKTKLAKSLFISYINKIELADKRADYFAFYESEFGPFPDDLNAFSDNLLKLQGIDTIRLKEIKNLKIINKIVKHKTDRILMVIIII